MRVCSRFVRGGSPQKWQTGWRSVFPFSGCQNTLWKHLWETLLGKHSSKPLCRTLFGNAVSRHLWWTPWEVLCQDCERLGSERRLVAGRGRCRFCWPGYSSRGLGRQQEGKGTLEMAHGRHATRTQAESMRTPTMTAARRKAAPPRGEFHRLPWRSHPEDQLPMPEDNSKCLAQTPPSRLRWMLTPDWAPLFCPLFTGNSLARCEWLIVSRETAAGITS